MPNEASQALTALSEAARAKALERFAWLRPCLEEGVPLARLARESEVPLRTAQDWLAAYRQRGLAGLARRTRADRGQHRLPPDLQHLIEGLALRKPPPTVATIHRQIATIAEAHGWKPPSYSRVYSIVRQLDPALMTLAQEGSKAYEERFDLLYRREASRPNEIWQADHTPLDIRLLDERGRPAWPWLTAIIDDHSRAVAGYYVSFQAPSAIQTALALHQAIWRKADAHWHVCGIPERLYTDHGSDFTSAHLEQVAADLKIRLSFSRPARPRGRGRIERFFETVNEMLLSTLPGYSPERSTPAAASLTLPAFDTAFREWLLNTYHTRVHSETNQTPHARWEAGGFLPRLPESREQLDLLLLTVAKPRRVHQDGIHFQGQRYMDLTLASYVEEDVTIRYDPRDLAVISIFHEDAFLCHAICPELAGQSLSLKEVIRARNARRRHIRAELRERTAFAEQLLASRQGLPQPLPPAEPEPAKPPRQRLKRYFNE